MFKTTWLLVWSLCNLVLLINGRDYFFVSKVIISVAVAWLAAAVAWGAAASATEAAAFLSKPEP